MIRVALVHRDSLRATERRMVGYWAYDVPEFEWDHVNVKRGFTIDRRRLNQDYDVIVYEDSKIYGQFINPGIPVAYMIGDSTAGQSHYQHRLKEAQKADLNLVDHDKLDRFPNSRRFLYCVNDRLFQDYQLPKTVDISFHCHIKGNQERYKMQQFLADYCQRKGLVFETGIRHWGEYAQAFSRSKITVNLSQTPTNRPHRIYDAMACRTCVVTSVKPRVSGEDILAGKHYAVYGDNEGLENILDHLLETGNWEMFADNGYHHVHHNHTWAVRSMELFEIFQEEFALE